MNLVFLISFIAVGQPIKKQMNKIDNKNNIDCQSKIDSLNRRIMYINAHLKTIEKENERLRDSLFFYTLPKGVWIDSGHFSK